jgi:hypothetical protein
MYDVMSRREFLWGTAATVGTLATGGTLWYALSSGKKKVEDLSLKEVEMAKPPEILDEVWQQLDDKQKRDLIKMYSSSDAVTPESGPSNAEVDKERPSYIIPERWAQMSPKEKKDVVVGERQLKEQMNQRQEDGQGTGIGHTLFRPVKELAQREAWDAAKQIPTNLIAPISNTIITPLINLAHESLEITQAGLREQDLKFSGRTPAQIDREVRSYMQKLEAMKGVVERGGATVQTLTTLGSAAYHLSHAFYQLGEFRLGAAATNAAFNFYLIKNTIAHTWATFTDAKAGKDRVVPSSITSRIEDKADLHREAKGFATDGPNAADIYEASADGRTAGGSHNAGHGTNGGAHGDAGHDAHGAHGDAAHGDAHDDHGTHGDAHDEHDDHGHGNH